MVLAEFLSHPVARKHGRIKCLLDCHSFRPYDSEGQMPRQSACWGSCTLHKLCRITWPCKREKARGQGRKKRDGRKEQGVVEQLIPPFSLHWTTTTSISSEPIIWIQQYKQRNSMMVAQKPFPTRNVIRDFANHQTPPSFAPCPSLLHIVSVCLAWLYLIKTPLSELAENSPILIFPSDFPACIKFTTHGWIICYPSATN